MYSELECLPLPVFWEEHSETDAVVTDLARSKNIKVMQMMFLKGIRRDFILTVFVK